MIRNFRGPRRPLGISGSIAVVVLITMATHWGVSANAAADNASPIGVWRTFDDRTGRERGLVKIEQRADGLDGWIVSAIDPNEASRNCEQCAGDLKNRPIIGLNIITGLQPDGDKWTGGKIVDPETGSVYHCSMRLADAGRKLVVRGYIAIPLLGRSQTWLRSE